MYLHKKSHTHISYKQKIDWRDLLEKRYFWAKSSCNNIRGRDTLHTSKIPHRLFKLSITPIFAFFKLFHYFFRLFHHSSLYFDIYTIFSTFSILSYYFWIISPHVNIFYLFTHSFTFLDFLTKCKHFSISKTFFDFSTISWLFHHIIFDFLNGTTLFDIFTPFCEFSTILFFNFFTIFPFFFFTVYQIFSTFS